MSLINNLIWLSKLKCHDLPAEIVSLAHFSLLDWIACGTAGVGEPVAQKLRSLVESEGGQGVSSLIGGGMAPARGAALVNGATTHALDFDDTHFAHVGHLSVGIYPAALAVAEEREVSAEQLVEAFLIGAEAAIRVGLTLGRSHYTQGFHQTATAGAFGATIAAGRLYQLSDEQMRYAIGLCATRASGLKSQFGTMGKPYNAGIAASNGIECAKLALLGMTSAEDGLMGEQGFVETHTLKAEPEAGWRNPPPGTFLFADNKYKLHACCHGTHAMIEALLGADDLGGRDLEDVAAFSLRTNPRWLRVCDIKVPRTGLEVKFSYNWLAGMTIRGDRTGDDRIYLDSLADDAALSSFAKKVEVLADDRLTDMQAEISITFADGSESRLFHDLAARLPTSVLAEKLRAKAISMIGETGAMLWENFGNLRDKTASDIGFQLRRAQ